MIEAKRRAEPPPSLARTQAYDGDDVKDALEGDFHGKCYLCEGHVGGTFNIEHLRPKAEKTGFPELRRTWTNLFPAHGQQCNNRRAQWIGKGHATVDGRAVNWPVGGMLDCAAPDMQIERRLSQWGRFRAVNGPQIFFQAIDPNDTEATNTAHELTRIHGDTEDDPERHGRTIRGCIHARYTEIQEELTPLIRDYYGKGAGHLDTREKAAELRRMLAPDQPYAGVLRGTLRRWLAGEFEPAFITLLGLDLPPAPAPATPDPPAP
ncbi:MAG: hypothetical protein R3F65_25610 [bacterium]